MLAGDRRPVLSRAALVLLAVLPADPSSGAPPAETRVAIRAARTVRVTMTGTPPRYGPAEVTIRVGDWVEWVNAPQADLHAVREYRHGAFAAEIPAGQSWPYRFLREGEYEYGCRYHPWMKGRIIVQPAQLALEKIVGPHELRGDALVSASTGDAVIIASHRGWVGFLGDPIAAFPIEHAHLERDGAWAASSAGAWFMGKAGALMFVERRTGRVRTHRLGPSTRPSALAAATVGWIYDAAAGRFGALNPDTGTTVWGGAGPAGDPPRAMVLGGDGQIYFATTNGMVGRYNIATQEHERFTLAQDARVTQVAGHPTGAWVFDAGRGRLLSISRKGMLEIPLHDRDFSSLAAKSETEAWGVSRARNRVIRVIDGELREYDPGPGAVAALAADSTGDLWILLDGGVITRLRAYAIAALP
jgi:plastocyanin